MEQPWAMFLSPSNWQLQFFNMNAIRKQKYFDFQFNFFDSIINSIITHFNLKQCESIKTDYTFLTYPTPPPPLERLDYRLIFRKQVSFWVVFGGNENKRASFRVVSGKNNFIRPSFWVGYRHKRHENEVFG